MALGAFFAWIWIPELQTGPDRAKLVKTMHWPILPNKELETLAKGWKYANSADSETDPRTGKLVPGENQKLGFQKIPNLYRKFRTRFAHGGFERP